MAAPGAARFYRPPFLAHTGRMTARPMKEVGGICSSVPYLMARLLNRLLLIALAKGKLPMNEYAVVKEQAKGGSERTPFTHRPETVGVSTLLRKKFFNFSMARFRDLATA